MMKYSKIRRLFVLCLPLLMVAFAACEHRPLEDPYNMHYVRVYIDEQIKNVTYGFYDESRLRPEYIRPRVLRVALCDPITNKVVVERYLQTTGEDERGYYIDGYISAEEGEYNLMIYNFGTEKTKIRDEYNYSGIQAYTSQIPKNYHQYIPMSSVDIAEEAIRYCPDHLFVANCQPVKVGKSVGLDTLRNQDGDFFTARSIVLSYYLQIKIKGFNYVSTAVSLLSGMAGSTTLSDCTLNKNDAVSIFFDMDYADVQRTKNEDKETAILYATFNTFGKLPEERSLYTVNFEFNKSDGTSQVETIDITPMFFGNPQVVNEQSIILEKEIEISPPIGSGGMTPGVDEWGDIWTDIYL